MLKISAPSCFLLFLVSSCLHAASPPAPLVARYAMQPDAADPNRLTDTGRSASVDT